MDNKEKTITIEVYPSMAEAKMSQDKLKANGIESMLNDENVLGMDPVGGVELRVFEKDKVAATSLIATGN